MASPLDYLFGPGFGGPMRNPGPFTPGINPNAPDPYEYLRQLASGSGFGGGPVGPTPPPPLSTPITPSAPQTGLKGLLGKIGTGMQSPLGQFGMNLLAQSGPSLMPQSTLSNIGQAGLRTQAGLQAQDMNALQKKLIESQIGRNQQLATQENNPFGSVDPSKFTEESIKKFEETGRYSDLKLRESSRLSTADIANYEYLAKLMDEDPSGKKVEMFLRGKRDPKFQNVPGAGFGAPSQITGEFGVSVPEETIVAGTQTRAEVGAEGSAVGAARGDQAGKAPVQASFEIAANNMRDAIKGTPQGGTFGIAGGLGTVFDYQDAIAFDNASQQLSTELRTVFRIPGEGTLSDREQEQYNLQLPNRKYSKERNEKIVSDLEARMNARINTPIGNDPGVDKTVDAIADKYLDN